MRPVHIVVLLLAGALGGAVIMKVAQKSKAPAGVPREVAQVRTIPAPVEPPAPAAAPPAPEPAQVVETTPAAVPEKAKPSPMPARRDAPKPQRYRPAPPMSGDPEPVERPVVAPEPPAPELSPPSPTTAPPAVRAEPENATPVSPQGSAASAMPPHQVTLNAGLLLPVRLVDGLSSERNVPGDAFAATLEKELVVDGFVIAERGARVEGKVVTAERGGNRAQGGAALAVELTRLHTSDGQVAPIQTDSFFKHAEANNGQTAAVVGGGAVIGAVIGAIAGGGKGAAIGAGVGGGAGAGGVLLTRGKPAELPTETRVTFRIKTAVLLTEQR